MGAAVYQLLGSRYLIHRWDRAVLIVASIALGVATLVSTQILNQCVEAAAQDSTTPGGSADLYVTNGEGGVRRALADDLKAAKIPGIESIHPIVFDRVILPDLDNRFAVLLGTEMSSQLLKPDNSLKVRFNPVFSVEGLQLLPLESALSRGDLTQVAELWDKLPSQVVVIGKPIFDEWKKNGGGKPLVVSHAGRRVKCLVIGWVDFDKDSPLAPLGKNFIGMEVGQASRLLRPAATTATGAITGAAALAGWAVEYPAKVNRLDVFLAPGVSREQIRPALEAIVGTRAEVRTPEGQQRSTQEVVSGLQTGFLVCSAGAMIVGLFLVYNSMAVTVAERRQDIGTLRAVGATRVQIVVLFAATAAVLGLIGALVGIPLGVLLSQVLLSQFQAELESIFLNPDLNPGRLSSAVAGLAAVAGVGTAVFAALVPALQAAASDPADVVRRSAGGAKGVWLLVHRLTCLTLVGTGLVMVMGRAYLPHRVGGIGGMMVVLVGLLLSAPIFVTALVRFIRPVVRAVCGIEMRMAFDNLTRAPGRTGVVIGALGAGVAMMFQTAGVGRSNEEPLVDWIREVVQADLFVFSGTLSTASSSNSPMPQAIVREMGKLPHVERVMGIKYVRPDFNGTVINLVALDAEAYARATRARVPNGLPGLERFLELPGTDNVLVSENFSVHHGIRVGDTFDLPGPAGPIPVKVIGTVRDYSWSRGTVMMDRARYAKHFGDELVDICHVFLKPGFTVESSGVEAFAADHGLMTSDRDSIRRFLTELIDRVYILAYMQQVVVGIVAALGVVTALLISVLQRKRELGLLLAVGATPGQVMRGVLAEAVLMGVFGTAMGILIGLPLEWYALNIILREESGFLFEMLIPWRPAMGIAAAAILTATLAGLVPAYHAVRTRIPEAIQWE